MFVDQHPSGPPESYPHDLEELVALSSGEVLWIRPIVPSDAAALAAEFAAADDDTIYERFFNPSFSLTSDRLRYLTEVDYRQHLAIVAMTPGGGRSSGVAIARFVARSVTDVEGAIVVKPEFRRRGVARLLLARLMSIAGDFGYQTMTASYVASNVAAGHMLASFGFGSPSIEEGIIEVTRALPATAARSAP